MAAGGGRAWWGTGGQRDAWSLSDAAHGPRADLLMSAESDRHLQGFSLMADSSKCCSLRSA